MGTRRSWETLDVVSVFKHGAIGGLIAGAVFAVAEVVAAVWQGLPPSAPVQMIAAVVLGARALTEVEVTFATVGLALGLHAFLSVVYGVMLALVSMATLAAGTSVRGLTLAGMGFGFVLWLVNFFLIAPLTFPWLTPTDRAVQFVAHVFFYGAPLGFYLGKVLAHSIELEGT